MCEARQVLEVAPELVHFVARGVDRDRLRHVHDVVLHLVAWCAFRTRLSVHRTTEWCPLRHRQPTPLAGHVAWTVATSRATSTPASWSRCAPRTRGRETRRCAVASRGPDPQGI